MTIVHKIKRGIRHYGGKLTDRLGVMRDLRLIKKCKYGGHGAVVCLVCRNERSRLPFFLKYYRSIGVQEFIIIDNESTDGSQDFLKEEAGVTLFALRFGAFPHKMRYVNYVLDTLAKGSWVLHVDVDEIIVHPLLDKIKIDQFCDLLGQQAITSVWTPMIDMYPDQSASLETYQPGTDYLGYCDRYDRMASYRLKDIGRRFDFRGGPRARLFYSDKLDEAPQCSKTSLLKWEGVRFASEHMTNNSQISKACVIAPLLHFKFFDDFSERARKAVEENQHWNDAAEYRVYLKGNSGAGIWDSLNSEKTRTYQGAYGLLDELFQFADSNIPNHFVKIEDD